MPLAGILFRTAGHGTRRREGFQEVPEVSGSGNSGTAEATDQREVRTRFGTLVGCFIRGECGEGRIFISRSSLYL